MRRPLGAACVVAPGRWVCARTTVRATTACVTAWLITVFLVATSLATPLAAQDSSATRSDAPRRSRPIRLVLSGGMAVPTGGFSTYHDLGVQASGSALIRIFRQKLRLRPEVAYARFSVVEQKVRAIVAANTAQVPGDHLTRARSQSATVVLQGGPKLPDLTKLRDGAISSALGTFANIELPLGPAGLQPYLIGGIGGVAFRSDVTTVGRALDGIQWAYNAGVGVRFRLGPLGGGLEARLRNIPVDESRTFFRSVTAVPVAFSLIF
jgi:hypothetical protein